MLRPHIFLSKVRAKTTHCPSKVRAKTTHITYRRHVVIKTGSRTARPVETKIRGFQNPKPGSKAAPAAATRPLTPLSLSAKWYGPVLAVKGSASPRFAPWTAPVRARGLVVYERKGGTETGGGSPKDAVAQTSDSATIRPRAPRIRLFPSGAGQGGREPLKPINSPIPRQGPLGSAPSLTPTTKGIFQNLPATLSPGNPEAIQVREGCPARESGEEDLPPVS